MVRPLTAEEKKVIAWRGMTERRWRTLDEDKRMRLRRMWRSRGKQKQKEENPMTTRLAELKQQAEQAVARFKSREATLYQHGYPIHPYERHQQILAEWRAERNAVLAQVMEEARIVSRKNQAQVDSLRDFPRDAILSSSERSEVNARLGFVRGQFKAAGPERVRDLLVSFMRHGSKAEQFAAWQAAQETKQRFESEGLTTAAFAFATQLEELVRGLFEKAWKKRAQPYVEAVRDAIDLEEFCFTRRNDAQHISGTLKYAGDEHFARQKYARGGKPLVPSGAGGGQPTGETANESGGNGGEE